MDCICEKQIVNVQKNLDVQQVEMEKQEMILELLEILFEQGDIKADELQRAKYILRSEDTR